MSVERLVPDTDPRAHVIREHVARYAFAAQHVSGKRVLDVACGSGYGSALLRRSGALRVTGVDLSDDAIAYARSHYAADGIEFLKGDAERISLSGPVDLVVSFETIEHIRHPEAFLAESVRLLAPGGLLIVSTPVRQRGTIDEPPANPHHLREWSLDEYRALLGQHYRHVEMHGQYTFRKGVLPYSRTIKNWLFRIRFPNQAAGLAAMDVRPVAPAFPGFGFAMSYAVAVCWKD